MSILTVGPGQEYATLSAAVGASHDGDVLQILAGTYTNDFAEIGTKITIEGVGGLAHLQANGPIPNGKAILITDTSLTLDHIEFSGATVHDGNGAGIRYQGGALIIQNSYFVDNQNGILAANDPSGSITITNSEFSHNGSGTGFTHGIYVGDVGTLTIDNSYFHDAVVGHELKSRAENTVIINSRIADGPNGTASYTINLPNAGNAVIQNNVIEKGPHSQNPVMISYGEEGHAYPNSALQVMGNTILDDQNSEYALGVRNSTPVQANVSGNSVYGVTSSRLLQGSGTAAANTILAAEPSYSTASAFTTTPPVDPPVVVPEPVSASLLALPVAVLALIRRRWAKPPAARDVSLGARIQEATVSVSRLGCPPARVEGHRPPFRARMRLPRHGEDGPADPGRRANWRRP